MLRFFALLTPFMLLFSGCSTRKAHPNAVNLQSYKKPVHTKAPKYKLKHKSPITLALMQEYKKWYNTPYKYGGTNSCGIDCSALVQRIYKDAFNLQIPRTTKQQIEIGRWVKKSQTKEGDLLFFKTGYNILHTGIYLERGNFIHASSNEGVTISNLHDPYFKSNYYQARRILP
jgi:lipoprotein Spr/probable lipoprotein NlpC